MTDSKQPSDPTQADAYGVADASYLAAGELHGLQQLVSDFYHLLDTLPEATHLRAMHAQDLDMSKRKLTYFLSGWLGGPKLYAEHFGAINIPAAHRHLRATQADRDAWLLCMKLAINQQAYVEPFGKYLITQLEIPADRILAAGKP